MTGMAPAFRRIRTASGVPGVPFSRGKRNRNSPSAFERVNGVPGGGVGDAPVHISIVRPATGCAVGLVITPRTAVSPSGGRTVIVGHNGVGIRKSLRLGGAETRTGSVSRIGAKLT